MADSLAKAKEAMKDLERIGHSVIMAGVWLLTQDFARDDQSGDFCTDTYKNMDLTTAPYWITTDNGIDPIPISSISELVEFIEAYA